MSPFFLEVLTFVGFGSHFGTILGGVGTALVIFEGLGIILEN